MSVTQVPKTPFIGESVDATYSMKHATRLAAALSAAHPPCLHDPSLVSIDSQAASVTLKPKFLGLFGANVRYSPQQPSDYIRYTHRSNS